MSISISEHRASKPKPSPRRLPLRIEHPSTNLYLRLAICLPPPCCLSTSSQTSTSTEHKPLPPPCRLSTSAQTSTSTEHKPLPPPCRLSTSAQTSTATEHKPLPLLFDMGDILVSNKSTGWQLFLPTLALSLGSRSSMNTSSHAVTSLGTKRMTLLFMQF